MEIGTAQVTAQPEPLYLTVFTVTGRGDFPWDMLRYDKCWPATSRSAHTMQVETTDLRTIVLARYHTNVEWEPTQGRWNSFLWGVNVEPAGDH